MRKALSHRLERGYKSHAGPSSRDTTSHRTAAVWLLTADAEPHLPALVAANQTHSYLH
jgi:hypothetical protein